MSTLSVDTIQGQTTAANVKFPAGSVLQVVSTQLNTRFTRSGSTEADITGLAVTITPKFNTSKIMIMVSLTVGSGTTVVLDAAGETVTLMYTGTAWAAIATSSFATNIATVIQ